MSQQHSLLRLLWKMAGITIIAVALFVPAGHAFAQGGTTQQRMTMDGGGGSVSGGNFSLSSTIAQPAAGVLSGGNFTLIGGFWTPLGLGPTGGKPDNKFSLAMPFVLR